MLSLAPASILDVHGGTLAPGSTADLILCRPDVGWMVQSKKFASSSRVTPFEGQPVQGVIDATYVGGVKIFERHSK